MRNAMICVGFVLAMLLAWPMVFGGGGAAVNAATRPVSLAVPKPVKASVAAPESCHERYERSYAACSNDGGCRMAAGNHWDVCEATEARAR